MRRALLSPVLLAVALVLQLTVVNRLRLPGTGPDLVLLTVVALGLCGGPAAGAVTGFGAGLALDLAPPGSYLIGEYALVFCVIGYLCGRLHGSLNRSAALTIGLAMTAAATGEAAIAALGMVVSDPQVTWSAVRQVLPSSVVYDVAVTPFLLYGVMRAVRWADGLGRNVAGEQADGAALLARAAGLPGGALPGRPAGRTMLGGAGLLGGAGWLAGPVGSGGAGGHRGYRARGLASGTRKTAAVHVPSTPRLRQAAARTGDGWLGGGPRTALPAPRRAPGRPGRPPRLRPGAGYPGSAAARSPRVLPRSPATLRIAAPRRKDGNVGRGLTGSAPMARGARGSGPPGSAFRSRRPSVGAAGALAGSGAPGHGPRFRPDTRLRGGSSGPEMLRAKALRGPTLSRGGGPRRIRAARGATLRLRAGRRHDGVLGGGVLGRRGGTVGLGGLRGRTRRSLAVRSSSLRLGAGRRGDGTLGGGVLTSRRLWAGSRKATPRFRSRPFPSGRTSLLAALTHGRLRGRSTGWRIGSRRRGGLR